MERDLEGAADMIGRHPETPEKDKIVADVRAEILKKCYTEEQITEYEKDKLLELLHQNPKRNAKS